MTANENTRAARLRHVERLIAWLAKKTPKSQGKVGRKKGGRQWHGGMAYRVKRLNALERRRKELAA